MLRKFDILGKDFKFTHEKSKFKTALGSFLSVFILLSILTLLWYFGRDIYMKENPNTLKKTFSYENFPFVNYSNSNMFFAFRLDDKHGKAIEHLRYVEFLFYYNILRKDKESSINFLPSRKEIRPMQNCNEKFLDKKMFEKNRLVHYYCANFTDYLVGGEWAGSNKFKYISFKIKRCDQSTEKKYNVTCATMEEFKKEFTEPFYVDYFYQKNHVDPKNFEKPISKEYIFDYDMVGIEGTRTYQRIYYTYSKVITDKGWIFNVTSSENFLEHHKIRYGVSSQGADNKIFYEAKIFLGKTANFYSRRYIKLQEISAVIGGFIKFSFLIIKYLFGFYVSSEYNLFMYEKLLKLELVDEDFEKSKDESNIPIPNKGFTSNKQFELNLIEDHTPRRIEDESNNKITINQHNDKKLEILPNKPRLWQSVADLAKSKEIILNEDIKNIIEYKKKNRKKIKITFCEICTRKCVRLSSGGSSGNDKNKSSNYQKYRYELLMQAETEINKKMDIISLLKRNDQLDLLYKFVLNKNQCFMLKNRDLYNVVGFPDVDNKKKKKLDEEKRRHDVQDLLEYIKTKHSNDSCNLSDSMLYSYLSEEFLNELNTFK